MFILGMIVEHRPGVLQKVSSMFRRRGFNIESISVGPTEQRDLARMTITIKEDEATAQQLAKQTQKLIDVLAVKILKPEHLVTRELALVKLHVPDSKSRTDLTNYVNVFRSRIVDMSPESIIVEITGTPDKIDAFLSLVEDFGVIEISRTGITALERGLATIKNKKQEIVKNDKIPRRKRKSSLEGSAR